VEWERGACTHLPHVRVTTASVLGGHGGRMAGGVGWMGGCAKEAGRLFGALELTVRKKGWCGTAVGWHSTCVG